MRDSAAATQITGTGMLVGPYVSVGLGESLAFNASVFYGRSWNDISTTLFAQTFSGAFETERLMARARLEGEWMLDQLTLRPDVTLFLSREVSGDYVVRNAGGAAVTVAGTSVQEFRLSGGLSLETTVPLSDGLALTPTLGIRGGVAPGLGAGAVTDGFAVLSLGLALTGEHWTLKGVVEAQLETTGLRAGTVRGTLTGAF
jgi:hypothetical protein